MRNLLTILLLTVSLATKVLAQSSQEQKGGDGSNNVQIGSARDVKIQQEIGQPKKEVSAKTLEKLKCGVDKEFVEDLYAKPRVIRKITADEIGFKAPKITYCRYDSDQYELQILYSAENAVAAFVVRLTGKNSTFQRFTSDQSSMDWTLGKSTLAEIADEADPEGAWMSDDAKFVSYIEKHYFGRSGEYSDYYFCSSLPDTLSLDSTKAEINGNRTRMVPYAVLVTNYVPKENMTPNEQASWNHFLKTIVEVPGERYEGNL